jgi:hypothetical protein
VISKLLELPNIGEDVKSKLLEIANNGGDIISDLLNNPALKIPQEIKERIIAIIKRQKKPK